MPAVGVAFTLALSGCAAALSGGPETGAVLEGVVTDGPPGAVGESFAFPDLDGAPQQVLDEPAENESIAQIVQQWSLREKVASMFMVHLSGVDLAVHRGLFEEEPVGGFLLLGDNVGPNPADTREFVAQVRQLDTPELLMAVDQEGGIVERLTDEEGLAPPDLGEGDPAVTTEDTQRRNGLVFEAGANVNLGVIADVSPGPDAYIHPRSFGSDVENVSQHVIAALEGSIQGVAVAVKHFPGHGVTDEDTHETLGVSELDFTTWRDEHGAPFRAAIDRGVDLVMMGHLVAPAIDDLPASVSQQWVELLRNQWGYQGVIVSDDLGMLLDSGDDRFDDPATNAVFAISAGVDLIIDSGGTSARATQEQLTESIDAVVAAVERGDISEASIDESAVRLLTLRESLGGVVRPLEDSELGELDG